MGKNKGGRGSILAMLVVDALLVCGIVVLLVLYSASYQQKIREQNLSDITNLNRSTADISSVYYQNSQGRLSDAAQYATTRGLTPEQTLSYICDANSGDQIFELVGTDATGYAAVRSGSGFVPIDYTSNSYESFAKIFTEPFDASSGVKSTQEFTDPYNARKSFALYVHLQLPNGSGTVSDYTLLETSLSSVVDNLIQIDGGYEGMSTVIVNEAGDYVFSSADFKSDNLFKYFYVFNNLSLDERQELATDFRVHGEGTYYFKDGAGRDCVFVYTAAPATQWYSVSCVPLSSFRYDAMDFSYTLPIGLLLVAMLAFNMTWLLRSNRSLKLSAEREKEASSAKTDFLSRMSHDIRTPLNVIIGSTILARREDNPPATQEHLDNIDHSGKFLLSLVNDILDLNKVESGKMELFPEPYAFAQFRANIVSIIKPLCESKGIDFTIAGKGSNATYLLDPVRLNQIFFNILSNSVKFTDPGGHIALEVEEKRLSTDRGMLNFTVSDDGRGMGDDFQKQMFESFSQERVNEKSKTQGTGLGLAIVKSLVDLMGGTIRVESALGKGTTFFVSIPAEVTDVHGGADASARADLAILAGKRVLLCEDNEINAQIAATIIRQAGLEVDVAEDGQKGLDAFESSEPFRFDAVLMDLRMPNMDGIEATKAIRALDRDDARRTPIIAMTANAYDEDVRTCLAAGMNAHIAKPIDPDILFSTLARNIAAAQSASNEGRG